MEGKSMCWWPTSGWGEGDKDRKMRLLLSDRRSHLSQVCGETWEENHSTLLADYCSIKIMEGVLLISCVFIIITQSNSIWTSHIQSAGERTIAQNHQICFSQIISDHFLLRFGCRGWRGTYTSSRSPFDQDGPQQRLLGNSVWSKGSLHPPSFKWNINWWTLHQSG